MPKSIKQAYSDKPTKIFPFEWNGCLVERLLTSRT